MSADSAALAAAVEARLPLAARLFDDIHAVSVDSVGVTRPAWSKADSKAAELIAAAARECDLEVTSDPAGNLYCTLPGNDRAAPKVMTGSHLDSVPTGGHYDGLAGAIAGLVVQAAMRDAGLRPGCDVTTMGIRGEESVWYGIAYVGSRLAVGNLPLAELDRLRRGDTGRSLAEHMADVGVNVAALRAAKNPTVSASNTRAFFELHIEQGPVLVGESLPIGVPTVIRGNVRFPYAHCLGGYGHSGATPRAYRNDAALAVVELLHRLDQDWIKAEAAGVPDTVFTVGKLFTDPAHHAMTKIPGRCDFTLNFGGTTKDYLEGCRDRAYALAAEIAARRRVRFEMGDCVGSDPTPLDERLRGTLTNAADALDIAHRAFATVGHDASIFARAGIPAAMILVRNAHGSHNPDEAMDLADFGEGIKVLAAAIAAEAG